MALLYSKCQPPAGCALLSEEQRDPSKTSTIGTGELLLAALHEGAQCTRRSASKADSAVHAAHGRQTSSASSPGWSPSPITNGNAQGSCAQLNARTVGAGSSSAHTAESNNGTNTSGDRRNSTAGTNESVSSCQPIQTAVPATAL